MEDCTWAVYEYDWAIHECDWTHLYTHMHTYALTCTHTHTQERDRRLAKEARDKEISADNKGSQLLSKMGWRQVAPNIHT